MLELACLIIIILCSSFHSVRELVSRTSLQSVFFSVLGHYTRGVASPYWHFLSLPNSRTFACKRRVIVCSYSCRHCSHFQYGYSRRPCLTSTRPRGRFWARACVRGNAKTISSDSVYSWLLTSLLLFDISKSSQECTSVTHLAFHTQPLSPPWTKLLASRVSRDPIYLS